MSVKLTADSLTHLAKKILSVNVVKSLTVGGRDLKLLSVITDAVMEKGFNYNLSSCYLFTGKVGKFKLFGQFLD